MILVVWTCYLRVVVYSVKSPLECRISSVRYLGGNETDRSFHHIVIEHNGLYNFEPGQQVVSLDVHIPCLGISERTNRPHPPRSYSLAPVLDEDGVDPKTCFSLGIRAPVIPPGSAPLYRNICICSQFLSGAEPGTLIRITGPFGKFVLSPDDLQGKNNLLFIATGTGIVPYMGFLKSLLKTYAGGTQEFGSILLFFGIQSPSSLLYRSALDDYVERFKGRFAYIPCYSRFGDESERCYVQDKILKAQDVIRSMCCEGGRQCSIFVCGRKSMEKAVASSLQTVFAGIPQRDAILASMKVEVYQ
ncbi:oxidoreductase NAD-binding domain containing protein, putative [Babesia bigemina]|uniref:ferredoxin--NADP(+) reductase n=1 Tax=Babesia bigemina TaxID=5866 RepID=A0A061D1X7_BABBI|nr:oxidoreductase NAD-binding domain containing protein, putative [Babesia bigemina]CDR94638.1 oxidoreductase NAD-binding domain containing protein, putative [Babesia bigemina]|eukprot:XP_012766824.1 oxidoreductase NAD-binding domain containing protein, putative [Babesia bigemina]